MASQYDDPDSMDIDTEGPPDPKELKEDRQLTPEEVPGWNAYVNTMQPTSVEGQSQRTEPPPAPGITQYSDVPAETNETSLMNDLLRCAKLAAQEQYPPRYAIFSCEDGVEYCLESPKTMHRFTVRCGPALCGNLDCPRQWIHFLPGFMPPTWETGTGWRDGVSPFSLDWHTEIPTYWQPRFIWEENGTRHGPFWNSIPGYFYMPGLQQAPFAPSPKDATGTPGYRKQKRWISTKRLTRYEGRG